MENITISVANCNSLTIENDNNFDIFYDIGTIMNSGNFEFTGIYHPIGANGSINIDLTDNLYKIIFQDDEPSAGYFVSALCNIEQCDTNDIIDLLCSCDDSEGCRSLELRKRMKMRVLFTNLSYYIKKFVESQTLTIFVEPSVSDLVYIKELLNALSDMCGCHNEGCADCAKTKCKNCS